MKSRIVIAVTLAALAATAGADDGRFTASLVPAAHIRKPGRIVIRNDQNTITAFRFFGDIREALVTLKSRRVAARAFEAKVFDSSAHVTAVPSHLEPLISDAARTHGVDPRLVAAVMRRESHWNPNAISPVGACGLMQLMPATAKYLGVADVFDARQNIEGGTRYLKTLLTTFNGDLDLTLAAYNAGPGAVARYNGVPPFRETKAYVKSIRAAYESALLR